MTESTQTSPRPGTLRSLLGLLTSLIQVRSELFSMEAQEQKQTLISNLLIALLSVGCLLLGLIAALIFITLISPPEWRPLLLGSISLILIIGAGIALWHLMRRLESQPAPFSLTITEVRKDLDALLSKD
jgi:uncharacterized membrane protein YqjE